MDNIRGTTSEEEDFKKVSGHMVEHRTVNSGDGGSIPPAGVSKLRQFRSPHICLCLSEETLRASGPYYLVYARGSKISNRGGKCVMWTLNNSREGQLLR